MSDFPETAIERARSIESILVAACEGPTADNHFYQQLRTELMSDPVLRPLLPEFVRTCRDLDHFWGYIKSISPKWAPRRHHIRDAMTPVFDHLEGANRAPVDIVASDVLQKFDADGVHIVWEKALARRHTDPDGAITSARTLLETVCKRILDEANETYSDKDDLPALYRAVALKLQIAPSQHTEDAFKRILGGATPDSQRPHYHFQMRVNKQAFIRYNDFHVPFPAKEIDIIEAKLSHPELIKHNFTGGAGMGALLNEDTVEKVISAVSSGDNEEEAIFKLDTFVRADEGTTISGDDLADLIEEAKLTGVTIASLLPRLKNASVQTIVTPGAGVVEQAPRSGRRKDKKK